MLLLDDDNSESGTGEAGDSQGKAERWKRARHGRNTPRSTSKSTVASHHTIRAPDLDKRQPATARAHETRLQRALLTLRGERGPLLGDGGSGVATT